LGAVGYIRASTSTESNMHNKYFFMGFAMLALWGCSSETLSPDIANLGATYFPLDTGSYRIYDVERIEYVFSGDNDTSRFFMKEVVADTFASLAGETAFRIERFVSESLKGDYQLDSVWVAYNNLSQAVLIENNIPFIKLVFPVREGLKWDGNSLNAMEEDTYEMIELNRPFALSDTLNFDKTLQVVQEVDDDHLIRSENRFEIYAENIGLIYKNTTILNFCDETDCIGQGIIETGIDYRMELVTYGKE
jgi:hypothetical protein